MKENRQMIENRVKKNRKFMKNVREREYRVDYITIKYMEQENTRFIHTNTYIYTHSSIHIPAW